MKTISNRIVSVIISLAAAAMCVFAPVVNAVQPETLKGAARMTLEVHETNANANSDVKVDIIAKNPAALRSLSNVGLAVEGNITPKSVVSNAGGTCNYTVSGNKISFSASGLGSVGNGGALFTVTYHVNDCAPGYYKLNWEITNAVGQLSNGSDYYPFFDYGYIRVVEGSQQPAASTTSTRATTTTTIATTTRPVTTTTTTKPNTDPNPGKYLLGDVNNDGTVDGSDATWVLREFGNVLGGFGKSFTPEQFAAGDIDRNDAIDGSDATLILMYYGEAGKDTSISYGGMEQWMQKNFWNK